MRQRGTVLKTSAGYEIFVSQQTGQAVFALRLGSDKLFLLEIVDFLSAGEANLAGIEMTAQGQIRVGFHHGRFATSAALHQAVSAACAVLQDIKKDIVDSLENALPGSKMYIHIEAPDDNPQFAELVIRELEKFSPDTAQKTVRVASLQQASAVERNRYLEAEELDWNEQQKTELLETLASSGLKTAGFNLAEAFQEVRKGVLQAREVLIEAGTGSVFVYIPLQAGLQGTPLGGYQSFSLPAWMPAGTTGVIRGDVRNARVFAEQPVEVLIIPKDTYLQHWYRPYRPAELFQTFSAAARQKK
jgi:hypothetical protein